MKRTAVMKRGEQPSQAPKRCCRECAHSRDWSDRAVDGHLILCRCRFDEKTEHGKFCKFLSDPECEHFQPRA